MLTPEKQVYSGKVRLITIPGSKGPFTVLRNHAPIISTIEKGMIRIVTSLGKNKFFTIDSGIVEVKNNRISLVGENICEEELQL